ncbi:MAG: gluconate 2-dehydrogenase subunit 3 family protein [Vicinamibacteria bacterium]
MASRRNVLRTLSLGSIGAATANALWADTLAALAHDHAHAAGPAPAAAADWTPKVLNAHQNETVIALSEAIIPQTETAGAKAALVNRFVDAVLEDADVHERKEFTRGLAWLDERSQEMFGADFVAAAADQQTALLTIMSAGKGKSVADQIGSEFFRAIKSMTITGYYTSEIGMKEELGDDGQVFFAEFKGCTHPEHGAPAAKPGAGHAPKKQG